MKNKDFKTFFGAALAAVLVLVAVKSIGGDPGSARSAVAAGQKAPAFHATDIDGKTINFPGDYKGKVVLLDFWATWCPPCRAALPGVVATYRQYHDKGFDVVGVSLDQPDSEPALRQFLKDHNMAWPQIYDGKYWQAAIAAQYGVHAIPCPLLVDGDTGKIIATEDSLLGENLPKTVAAALAANVKK